MTETPNYELEKSLFYRLRNRKRLAQRALTGGTYEE